MSVAENRLEGVPPAGHYKTAEVARSLDIHPSTLNRLAVALGRNHGSGHHIYWSWRDIQAVRIALRIEAAGAGDCLHVIARTVIEAHPTGGLEPVLAGWVAYRRGEIRYGATPSEAIGPLPGAVVAHLRGAP